MNETQPQRPDLSEDDLQRSPEQDPDRHRNSSAMLQEAITEVVSRCQGWSLDDTVDALQEALVQRDQPPQPSRWMEAVAVDAMAGRTYVVSQQALDDNGIDVPALDQLTQGRGIDRGQDRDVGQ